MIKTLEKDWNLPTTILLDTSIPIAHDRGRSRVYEDLLDVRLNEEVELVTSVLVIFEYHLGIKPTKKRLLQAKRKFEEIAIIPIDEQIAVLGSQLERKNQIGSFDSMIAATCLINDYQLATLNTKHFQMIKGLKIW